MKNDIKTKSFTVIRKYAPKEDDFWDDNPLCSEENHDDDFDKRLWSYDPDEIPYIRSVLINIL